MTLTKFLNYFDFDYCVYESKDNKMIGLIDLTGTNLGGIEEERYENTKNGVLTIIDRLDSYYEDYIFCELQETLEEEHHIDTSNMKWVDLYNKVKELNLDYDMNIMPYIFGDKELILDSKYK